MADVQRNVAPEKPLRNPTPTLDGTSGDLLNLHMVKKAEELMG